MKVIVWTFLVILMSTRVPAEDAGTWHQPAVLLTAEGRPLDTATVQIEASEPFEFINGFGHAAPCYVDVDGDGRRDLVLGTFSGRFRVHRNVGSNAVAKFTQEYRWLSSGRTPIAVGNSCCLAPTPCFVDLDGDQRLDIVSGSYTPGAIYWFRSEGTTYAERQMLTDIRGMPVVSFPGVAYPEVIKQRDNMLLLGKWPAGHWADSANNGSLPTFADWDGDGDLDLLIGTISGQIVLRLAKKPEHMMAIVPEGQPTYEEDSRIVVLTNGRRLVPGGHFHAAPAVADWNGDGLFDLIVGVDDGTVYYFPNNGVSGIPKFESREVLLNAGTGAEQLVAKDSYPERRGGFAQVHVVDYNLDGKLDLLVGCLVRSIKKRSDLTREEEAEFATIERELRAIDIAVGYDGVTPRLGGKEGRNLGYAENGIMLSKAKALEVRREALLETRKQGVGLGYEIETSVRRHGYTWLYLRK